MSTMKIVAKIAVFIFVVLVAVFIFDLVKDDSPPTPSVSPSADSPFLTASEGPPREYIYLDDIRVQAYLSQITDGLASQDTLSKSVGDKRAGELAAAGAKLGRDISAESAFERTISPTASSRFFNLRQQLHDRGQLTELEPVVRPKSRPCGLHPRASGFLKKWASVQEGDFIRVKAYLRLPPYARLYHTVRQAPPGSPLGTQGKPVVAAVGLDPKFSFAVCIPTGRDVPLRLVFPAQYSLLATEPSLIQGQLTFVGKVLSKLPSAEDMYRDVHTFQRFRPELDGRHAKLWQRLGVKPATLRSDLMGYYVLRGPAALVMPVAVYK
jgi:hypothetical protein